MYCPKCGSEVKDGNFCSNCGTQIDLNSSQQNQQSQFSYQPQYTYPSSNMVDYSYVPGSFVERLHNYGKSNLFLIGIVLFTVGNLVTIFSTFNIYSIISIILMILPIIGFWLIFIASKMPKVPEKTMTALTLFKVYIIIALVIGGLVALVLLIVSVVFIAGAGASQSYYTIDSSGVGVMITIGIIILIIAAIVVTLAVIYYRSVLMLISGIQNGIANNSFNPLPGIKTFTIFTYIIVAFAVLGILSMAASTGTINELMNDTYGSIDAIKPYISSFNVTAFSIISTLASNAGIVICIIVLNKFNNNLIYNNYNKQQNF